MKVHTFFKILLLPFIILFIIIFFLDLYKNILSKKFNYKKFSFELNIEKLPIAVRSSFLFNTYEYNDRKLVEKYIDRKKFLYINWWWYRVYTYSSISQVP